jgi:hypothetical protein
MLDFLTFKTFITPSLLVIVYAIGAILIPLLSYYLGRWLITRYFSRQKEQFYTLTTPRQRAAILLVSLGCFLCMEIMWRVMFEFFVAYFDMHAALVKLAA